MIRICRLADGLICAAGSDVLLEKHTVNKLCLSFWTQNDHTDTVVTNKETGMARSSGEYSLAHEVKRLHHG